jgi:ERF superfamily
MTQAKLIAALSKALPELEGAKKNKANPAFKSKYADLGAVIEAVEPIKAHGLWYRQLTHESPDGVMIETIYIHESGESLSAGVLFMPAIKKDAQGFGSALSYARRYSLQTAFGLATEDDDGNAAVKPAPPPELISGPQLDELQLLFDHLNVPVAEFLTVAQIKRLSELPANWFERAKTWINNRAKELRETKEA